MLLVAALTLQAVLGSAVPPSCTGKSTQLVPDQCAAWVSFYDSTNGDGWIGHCSGLRTDPCACEGFGGHMVCNDAGTAVTQVALASNNLKGTIPEAVGAWANITLFDITANFPSLGGTLPASIGHWERVEVFNVGLNALSGSIPATIGAWQNCTLFGVQDNALDGTLPASMAQWKNLNYLSTYANQFSPGALPALPFASMTTCELFDHPDGGANAFSCPWPVGAKSVCRNMTDRFQDSRYITDDDCTPVLHA